MSWPLLVLLAAGSYGLKALGVTTGLRFLV